MHSVTLFHRYHLMVLDDIVVRDRFDAILHEIWCHPIMMDNPLRFPLVVNMILTKTKKEIVRKTKQKKLQLTMNIYYLFLFHDKIRVGLEKISLTTFYKIRKNNSNFGGVKFTTR